MMLTPPPNRTADEWAEATRTIGMGAEKGPYRVSRTPYLRTPLQVASGVKYRRLALLCGSQQAKTQGFILNVMGKRLDDDPCPMIVGFPTKNAGESQFEPKLTSMLRHCPSLWAKTAQGKQNRKTHKKIAGMDVRIAWTGSAAEMASQEAGLVALDELDRMPDVPGEGDPVEVAEGRGATFPDFLMLLAGTPTLGTVDTYTDEQGFERWRVANPDDVPSRIWRAWQDGTRHEFMWPCPDCGLYFAPRMRHLTWPDGASLTIIRREARVKCPYCQHRIDDLEKTRANAAGLHVAPGQQVVDGCVEGNPPDSDCWSTWISGLCSPWRTFGSVAYAYAKAARSHDASTLQAVKNLRLGELYSVAGQALPWQEIKQKLMLQYVMGEVPEGVQVLVAGVDVQGDRLVYEVRGWGLRMCSWLIDTGELWGDPKQEQVWADLGRVLDTPRAGLTIRLMLVDSGYFPEPVYRFGRSHPDRVRVTKGARDDLGGRRYKASVTDVNARGKPMKRGAQLWLINTWLNKDFIWGRFHVPEGQSPGFHVPADVPDRYMLEVTGEMRLPVAKGGGMYQRLRANHAFDTATLTVVGAYMLGVERMVDPAPPVRRPQPVSLENGQPLPGYAPSARPTRFRVS